MQLTGSVAQHELNSGGISMVGHMLRTLRNWQQAARRVVGTATACG